MQAVEILRVTAHRPWPAPARPWAMTQTWRDLLFAHWPIPAEAMARLLPPGLPLDTYEGEAWVSVVPFRMDVQLRGLPGIPPFDRLLETNVRTYVTLDDKPGVYFFSLDASNRALVEIARAWYHLEYFNARFACEFPRAGDSDGAAVTYHIERRDPRAQSGRFEGIYRPTGAPYTAAPGSLEDWLTARYCLYSVDRHGRVYRGEIHHWPWPLQPAEAEISVNTLAASHGIALPDTPPLLQFSQRLDVVAWPLLSYP